MRAAVAVAAVVIAAACGLNIATLRPEHLQVPLHPRSTPVDAPLSVDVRTAERYAGMSYGGQVSVEADVIRDHVLNALRSHKADNIVVDPARAEYRIEAVFTVVGLDGTRTRTGFTSTWILYAAGSADALASTAVIAEENVPRFGFGKGRFRDAAARSIVRNTEDGLAVMLEALGRLQRASRRRDS